MADSDRKPDDDAEPLRLGTRPINAVRYGLNTFVRQFLALLGLVMIGVSIPIAVLTPFIPIGLPIGVVGVILLGRNSLWGRNWMEGVLSRHPKIERMAPNWVMKLVFGREKRNSALLNRPEKED